eukprot:3650809-Heterocapsa_arctica.AAC.1
MGRVQGGDGQVQGRDRRCRAEPGVWRPLVEGRRLSAIIDHPQRPVLLADEEEAGAGADAPAQADQPRVHQAAK